jgi:thioredoxin-related protein
MLLRIKNILILFVVFSLLSAVYASEFKIYKNYDKALKEAKKSNKNLMMMLYSPHCPWCERMKEETISQKETQDFISNSYVYVSLNKYRDNYPKKFQTNMIPTIFLIDSKNENENYKMLGFQTVESFIDEVSLSEGL